MTSTSRPDPLRLAEDAASAAEIRALALAPDVIALRVERIRGQVDACAWVAIGLGLAFTAVNVQTFAAAGAPSGSPGWLVAWLLDPMVSLLLIAVLRAEQVTARWQVATGWRVSAAKWGCFAATYAMNTWASWTSAVPSGVVLHSVPPLVVLLGAEVAPELRDRLTAAVLAAATVQPGPESRPGAGPTVEVDLPGEAARTALDPGQDRVAALAVPPTAGPRPGQDPEPDPTLGLEPETDLEPKPEADADGVQHRRHDAGADLRIGALAELLTAGEPVTGAQAAALYEVSERQGRRLLREAREQASTARAVSGPTATGWGRLRVVPGGPLAASATSSRPEDSDISATRTASAISTTVAAPGGER